VIEVRCIAQCRFCGGALSIPFCDLGTQPLANAYVPPERAAEPDERVPLAVRVCGECRLAQLDHVADFRAIFTDYAYLSSVSTGWVEHAFRFAAAAIARLGLSKSSLVVEVASNDGYLLRHVAAAGIPCLGVEPAANVAAKAQAAGLETLVRFFGRGTARDIIAVRGHADLVVANNVFAHVPDINDFAAGLALLAGPQGIVSIETPHLVRLVQEVQFDTIYHEHYAYWSLLAAERVLGAHGLAVFDVERLPTHGGSLRLWACASGQARSPSPGLMQVRAEEERLGVAGTTFYEGFSGRVRAVLSGFRSWLAGAHEQGRLVAAYGAAAKGNTFLNAAGVGPDAIPCVADASPAKQGRLLPGSRIPVVSPSALVALRPDDIVILPWNIADEVVGQLASAGLGGARFVTAIPSLAVRGGVP
jgi:2-polyprenyl-3-methyl-5-hydroxy-6-metoxy-1,4-benzoquinol methylase